MVACVCVAGGWQLGAYRAKGSVDLNRGKVELCGRCWLLQRAVMNGVLIRFCSFFPFNSSQFAFPQRFAESNPQDREKRLPILTFALTVCTQDQTAVFFNFVLCFLCLRPASGCWTYPECLVVIIIVFDSSVAFDLCCLWCLTSAVTMPGERAHDGPAARRRDRRLRQWLRHERLSIHVCEAEMKHHVAPQPTYIHVGTQTAQTVDNPMQQDDIPQEHISERIMEVTGHATVPQVMEGIVECERVEIENAAPALAVTIRRRMAKRVAPALAWRCPCSERPDPRERIRGPITCRHLPSPAQHQIQ